MAQKPETVFRQNIVLPFLKELKNCAYFPIQQQTIRGDADLILCINGHFVWLELKKDEEEKLRPLQMFKADWVRKTGGTALKADPDNWSTVMGVLKQLDGER